MTRLSQLIQAIRDQFESWGARLPRASDDDRGPHVVVFGPSVGSERSQRIGTLWQQGGEFVFRYDPAFVASDGAKPLDAFPALDQEYRSRDLWPFFAVRIPPPERSDVRKALEQRGIRPDQTLEVLGTIAQRSVSNPYRLELSAQN